jgi:hypothetical protein
MPLLWLQGNANKCIVSETEEEEEMKLVELDMIQSPYDHVLRLIGVPHLLFRQGLSQQLSLGEDEDEAGDGGNNTWRWREQYEDRPIVGIIQPSVLDS